MKIYMDVCCFNRPFDMHTHHRVSLESDAIVAILDRCKTGEWTLAGSDMIEMELEKCPNPKKLENMWDLYSLAEVHLSITTEIKARARVFQNKGLKLLDSLHLALAEGYRQDILLTTDDAFLSVARRLGAEIRIANPVSWYMEMTQHDY